MRWPALALAVAAACSSGGQVPRGGNPVEGAHVARGSLAGVLRVAPASHCGGANMGGDRPTSPALAPVAGATLIVRAGGENSEAPPAAEVTTGTDGGFTAEVAPGRYCIVESGKRAKPTAGSQYEDLACLVDQWRRCDAVAEVPSTAPVAMDLRRACFGSCYHGPMPP